MGTPRLEKEVEEVGIASNVSGEQMQLEEETDTSLLTPEDVAAIVREMDVLAEEDFEQTMDKIRKLSEVRVRIMSDQNDKAWSIVVQDTYRIRELLQKMKGANFDIIFGLKLKESLSLENMMCYLWHSIDSGADVAENIAIVTHTVCELNSRYASPCQFSRHDKSQRGIMCVCSNECRHIDPPFCPYCVTDHHTPGFCKGCGTTVTVNVTHCCQCHGNPRMCPICGEYHDSHLCVNTSDYDLPNQIVGNRKRLGILGVQAYIMHTSGLAMKYVQQNPTQEEVVAKFMRRVCALMPNSAYAIKEHAGPKTPEFFLIMGNFLLNALSSLKSDVMNGLTEAIKGAVSAWLTEVTVKLNPAIVAALLFLKTLVRKHIFECCPLQTAVEILWDPSFYYCASALKNLLSGLLQNLIKDIPVRQISAHAGSAVPLLTTAMFFMGTSMAGLQPEKLAGFLRVVPIFEKIMPTSLPEFLAKFPLISRFMKGDIEEHMKTKCPQTWYFLQLQRKAKIEKWDELWQLSMIQDGQTRHLREWELMTENCRIYWAKYKSELYVDPAMLKKLPSERMEPLAVLFYGLAGGGKTITSTILLNIIYLWLVQVGLLDPQGNFTQAFYDIQPGAKFWGGFFHQRLMRANDIFTAKSLPGDKDSEALMLMQLIDIAPYEVPGADLSRKGQFAKAIFLALTSNLSLDQIINICQLNNSPAMRRRIWWALKCIPYHATPDGVMSKDEAIWGNTPLSERCCFIDEETGQEFTLAEVAIIVIQELRERINRAPVTSCVPDMWNKLKDKLPATVNDDKLPVGCKRRKGGEYKEPKGKEEEDKIEAHGLSDWFGTGKETDEIWEEPGAELLSFVEELRTSAISQKPEIEEEDVFNKPEFPNQINWMQYLIANYWRKFGGLAHPSPEAKKAMHVLKVINGLSDSAAEIKMLNQGFDHLFHNGNPDHLPADLVSHYERYMMDLDDNPEATTRLHREYADAGKLICGTELYSETASYEDDLERSASFKEHLQVMSLWETLCTTYCYLKMKACDIAYAGKKITVEAANIIAQKCGALIQFPSSVREVNYEKFAATLKEHILTTSPEYKGLIVGVLVLLGMTAYYGGVSCITGQPKTKTVQAHGVAPDKIFSLSSVVQSDGFVDKVNKSSYGFSTNGVKSCGSAFAITSTEFVVPKHLMDKVDTTFYLKQKGETTWESFRVAEKGIAGGAVWSSDSEIDMALVQLTRGTIPGMGGKNLSKIALEIRTEPGFVLTVDHRSFTNPVTSFRPLEQILRDDRVRLTAYPIESPSVMGKCGTVYVDMNAVNDSRVVAMHIAGNDAGGYAAPITQPWVLKMREALQDWSVCGDPEEMEAQKVRGYDVAGLSTLRNNYPHRHPSHPLDSVIKGFAENGFPLQHAPCVLTGQGPDGKTPVQTGTDKILARHVKRRNNPVHWQFTNEEWKHVTDVSNFLDMDEIPTWDDIALGEIDTAINWQKSAGLAAGSKKDFRDEDGYFLDWFRHHLDSRVRRMEVGDYIADRSGSTMKVELRPLEKVDKRSTRIFYNGDFDSYVICKAYCSVIYRWLSAFARESGMHYECTAEESAEMRKQFWDFLSVGADVEGQEVSHSESAYEWVFRFLLDTNIFKNSPKDCDKYSALFDRKMEKKNWVRWGCFVQLMNAIILMEKFLIRAKGILTSGSFLTSALNHLVEYILGKLFKMNNPCYINFLGDDKIFTSLIVNSLKSKQQAEAMAHFILRIKEHWAKFGYSLTSQEKDKDLFAQRHQQIPLCGRTLIREGHNFMCPLAISRVIKSVCFYKSSNPEIYAQTLLNFLFEIRYHPTKVADRLTDSVRWENGIKLKSFLPKAKIMREMIQIHSIAALQRGIREFIVEGLRPGRKASVLPRTPEMLYFMPVVQAHGESDSTLVIEDEVVDVGAMHIKHNLLEETVIPLGMANSILRREVVVGSGYIAGTLVRGDILYQEMFVTRFFEMYQRGLMELENMAYLAFDAVEVRLQMNVSGWHSGGVVLTASPCGRRITSIESAFSGPHLLVNFQKNATEGAEMKRKIDVVYSIPFNRDNFGIPADGYLDPTYYMNSSRFTMMVAENGNSTVQGPLPYTIHARLVNPRLVESGSAFLFSPSPQAHSEESDLVSGPVSSTSVQGPSGIQHSTINNYPFSNVGNGISANVEDVSVGACKPTVPHKLSETVPGFGFCAANCQGGNGGAVLGSSPEGRGVMHPMQNGMDQMGFEYMCRQRYLVDRTLWTSATSAETLLWSGYVGPFVEETNGYVGRFPLLASNFMYWKADIVFHFEAFPNAMMTGTYMVCVDYKRNGTFPIPFSDTNNLYRVFVNLEEGCNVTVKVPYMALTPWKVASDTDLPRISLFAVTALGVNSGGSDTVPFNIFSYAENVAFMWPFYNQDDLVADVAQVEVSRLKELPLRPGKVKSALSKVLREPVVPRPSKPKGKEAVKSHGEEIFGDAGTNVPYASAVVLGPSVTRYSNITLADYFLRFGSGDAITDLRTFLKRFHHLNPMSPAPDTGMYLVHDPGVITNFPDWYIALSRAFVFQFGGFRYKVYPKGNWSATMGATWTRTGLNVLEPEAFMVNGTVGVSEVQLNACCKYPYRIISQNDSGMPQFYSTRSDAEESTVMFAVSEEFEWFGSNYLANQVFMPAVTNWYDQIPLLYQL